MKMILDGLNKQQRIAAETVNGNVAIIAGAGSGKTRTITYRIAHMVKDLGIKAESILALTFTNKAAKEMKERIEKLVGQDTGVTATTFHSFAYKFLRNFPEKVGYRKGFTIVDDEDQRELIKNIMKEVKDLLESLTLKRVKGMIGKAKDHGCFSKEEAYRYFTNPKNPYSRMDETELNQVCHIFDEYNKALLKNNAMDFSDLLINLKNILENSDIREMVQRRFEYFIVDEYQDTNWIQGEIIDTLSAKSQNLCVVGDPDQSIYAFRGAEISIINDFAKNHRNTKVVKLEENYRSTPEILEAANAVIANNPQNFDKRLWTSKDNGSRIKLVSLATEIEEGRYIAETIESNVAEISFEYKDFTILYRTNYQSRAIEQKLIRSKIPYKVFGGIEFYQRREVKDVLAFVKLFSNPEDTISFERICKCMKTGIGPKAIEKIKEFASKNSINFIEVFKYSKAIKGITKNAKDFLFLCGDMFEKAKTFDEKYMLCEHFYHGSGYFSFLDERDERERMENVAELVSSFSLAFKEEPDLQLDEYLAEITMYSSADEVKDGNYVSLMTAHKSKGLEFEYVFLAGAENGLFPLINRNALLEPEERKADLEEERRLFYVAMTRAMKRLEITYARFRRENKSQISTFVNELEGIELEEEYKESENVDNFWNMKF